MSDTRHERQEDWRDEIAAVRSKQELLAQRVETVVADVGGLRVDVDNKHRENRHSIHELRNNAQAIVNELHIVQGFFGENGAFMYMKAKVDGMETQNRWMIVLLISTLVGVIVTLATKH